MESKKLAITGITEAQAKKLTPLFKEILNKYLSASFKGLSEKEMLELRIQGTKAELELLEEQLKECD